MALITEKMRLGGRQIFVILK